MKNEFYVIGDEVLIKLPRRKTPNSPQWTIIDLVDLKKVISFHWFWRAYFSRSNNTYYAAHTKRLGYANSELIFLHDVIADEHSRLVEVDHKNINSLDNRKNNLRIVTRQINSFNKNLTKANISGTTGVCWHKPTKSWRAYIMLDRKHIHLGLFTDKQKAIDARLKAEDAYKP